MTTDTNMADPWLPRSELRPMHVAQFYDDGAFPDRPIADFLGAGLHADESVVIIATAEHTFMLQAHLATYGAALNTLERNGRLTVLDAQAMLDQFMVGELLNRAQAISTLGLVLDQSLAAAPSERGRVFGELVALLTTQGNFAAAIELERVWNELLQARPFRLYCAYPIRQFVHESLGELFGHVCDEHDEIVPVLTWLDKPERQGRWLAILQQQAHALRMEISERKKAQAELRVSHEQLRALAAALQSAREEERSRLARELHDDLGQMLTALKMDLARWSRRIAQVEGCPAADMTLSEAQDMTKLTDEAIQAMRRMLKELRPIELDTLGLVPALESQAQEFQDRTGIETHVTADVDKFELDASRALALFRIVQESLTNVARHANATQVEVKLRREATQWVLEVRDNGKGLTISDPIATGHWGILGMRERALLLGGTLDIQGAAQQGTTVKVSIPLDSPAKITASTRLA